MRRLIILVIILIGILGLLSGVQKYSPQFSNYIKSSTDTASLGNEKVKVVSEESLVINVVKKAGPSVVTIAGALSQQSLFNDQGPFSIFGIPVPNQNETPSPTEPQNIGSGFLVSKEGFVVTNKHVVSDAEIKYTVVTSGNKKFDVQKIYRDPLNDIAILQIDTTQNGGISISPLEMGDSSKLQVGQLAIAIGTPLGDFSNTVTTGVISGLGRGIQAGSAYEGTVEQLDNVIQTDAAINPGNSGGPLLNSAGQVIGVNTAVSQSGQNIGFALPINVIKDSLKNFNATGQFNRPYLGVAYRMISRDMAIRNDMPEGAYVQSVVKGSAAEKAGIQQGDIITKIDGKKLQEKTSELSSFIANKKVGDTLTLTVYKESSDNSGGQEVTITAVLDTAPQQ